VNHHISRKDDPRPERKQSNLGNLLKKERAYRDPSGFFRIQGGEGVELKKEAPKKTGETIQKA